MRGDGAGAVGRDLDASVHPAQRHELHRNGRITVARGYPFKAQERAKSIAINDAAFDCPSMTAAPGATVDFIKSVNVPNVAIPAEYMGRPKAVVTFDQATTRAK